jgi:alpha-L-rhamnosidase
MSKPTRFHRATPVWSEKLAGQMNILVSFHACLKFIPARRGLLRVAAAQAYRVWANGDLIGRGPARTAHGFARVDEWAVKHSGSEALELVIEVMGYGVPTFCTTAEPAFLCAELVFGRKVLAWTATRGGGFTAERRHEYMQKAERFSYQRAFVEGYRMGRRGCSWQLRGYVPVRPLELARVQTKRGWLARGVVLPDLTVIKPRLSAMRGRSSSSARRASRATQHRFLTEVPKTSVGYPLPQVDWSLFHELAGLKFTTVNPVRLRTNAPEKLTARQWLRVDFGRVCTGFPKLRLHAQRPARVVLIFDEILVDGQLVFDRSTCVNAVGLDLAGGVEINFETFEPYTLQHLQVLVIKGVVEVSHLGLRNFINASPTLAAPKNMRPAVAQVRRAAVASFRQNALDIFMDCPARERAGWLCDSLFAARAEWHLCRDNPVERAFLENYLLPMKFFDLPAGMVPMCYPAEALNRQFIPNWAMFLIVQLDEAMHERQLPKAWRPLMERRVRGLLKYFHRFENEFGLLEKLESWVFVEWSKANNFVQDVNFPSNMLYAATLRAAGRLLNDPALAHQAKQLESVIRQWAWRDGKFVDHAIRDAEGKLVVAEDATEVCQYYAFSYGLTSPRRQPALWRKLVREEFGNLHPANAFIGKLLRLELLIKHGELSAARRELMQNFAPMARRTGTLWEHLDESASCNHGFTAYIAVLIDRLEKRR